jgi:hypothetical protein
MADIVQFHYVKSFVTESDYLYRNKSGKKTAANDQVLLALKTKTRAFAKMNFCYVWQ